MSKAQRGDRSFQPGAGKGDASRITDVEAFRNNYDQIDWGRRLKRAVVPVLGGWDEGITDDVYRRRLDACCRADWEGSF